MTSPKVSALKGHGATSAVTGVRTASAAVAATARSRLGAVRRALDATREPLVGFGGGAKFVQHADALAEIDRLIAQVDALDRALRAAAW
ncbi:hypothetical protein [Amaricoccus sp.]|uniref:hypothetical protein n=1 Tax=Amaricoccus sp. TaxID=1872485 RepID=UPI001B65860C|nr:hypothetical protein [Amaricoccus sp.]MBP7002286.1 hypothetical protein [Amaricoccus sp.]